MNISPLGNSPLDRLKAVGRSKAFDLLGTVFAILSVILLTVNEQLLRKISLMLSAFSQMEVASRRVDIEPKGDVPYTLTLAFINLGFMIYFVLEIIIKAWAFGPINFYRSSWEHVLEATVALTCFVSTRKKSTV